MAPRIFPTGKGMTIITGVPARDDLRKSHNFRLGERVRLKPEHVNPGVEAKYREGVVARLPDGPVVSLGGRVLGNELAVDLDGGGRCVADVDHWERSDDDGSA